MNEKEKKAIEYLTNKVEIWKKQRPDYRNSDIVYEIDNEDKQIQTLLNLIEKLQKENEELKEENEYNKILLDMNNNFTIDKKTGNYKWNVIEIQKVKDIIDRIDYDIKKTKEIISKNTNIYASYRKNDYQIVRLKAMNTKSLDIKKRLQKLLESEK